MFLLQPVSDLLLKCYQVYIMGIYIIIYFIEYMNSIWLLVLSKSFKKFNLFLHLQQLTNRRQCNALQSPL